MAGFLSGVQQGASGGGVGQAIQSIKKKLANKKTASTDQSDSDSDSAAMEAMHHGGLVKQTKTYRLRKGERVLTKAQQRKLGIGKRMRGK